MTHGFERHRRGRASRPGAAGDAELAELRRLLVGPERDQIAALRRKVERQRLTAADVGKVLPEAVQLRASKDQALGAALSPTIEDGLQRAVRRNPKGVVDAIFPVIGPAIRRSVREALARVIQRLNQVLEHGLSPRALRWRFQAWRTGRPFAEIVMLHTLLYRVEEVFLIHGASGLMLQHVSARGGGAPDEDLVSGMLTAIQDFVRDSWPGAGDGALQTLQVGDLTVLVERGPSAILALVVRGQPHASLREQMAEVLEQVHASHGEALRTFQGDTGVFDTTRPALEPCLKEEPRQARRKVPVAALVLLLLLAVLVGGLGWQHARAASRWENLVERLRAEPGLVVTRAEERGRGYVVEGLRDPLAADPAALVEASGIAVQDVELGFEAYQAAHGPFVLARARDLLGPPPSVTLDYAGGVLALQGRAPAPWIEQAERLARTLAGVERVEVRDLEAEEPADDRLERARSLLDPPAGVTLRLEGDVLVAAGRAPEAWIESARVLGRVLPGVAGLDLDGVEAGDAAARRLGRARQVLRPPPGVELRLDGGTIVAEGRAARAWVERARLLAPVVEGVEGLDASRLVLEEDAQRILEGARRILAPPPSVTLRLEGEVVVARGAAPHAWLVLAERFAPLLEGVARCDLAGVVDEDRRRLEDARGRLEARGLLFERNRAELVADQDAVLDDAAEDLRALFAAARALGAEVAVEVVGHTDSSAHTPETVDLQRERARAVRLLLSERGVEGLRIGVAAEHEAAVPSEQDRPEGRRRVAFRVVLPPPDGGATR